MVWYGMVWYGIVWYSMVWYGMVWYGGECEELKQNKLTLNHQNIKKNNITLSTNVSHPNPPVLEQQLYSHQFHIYK